MPKLLRNGLLVLFFALCVIAVGFELSARSMAQRLSEAIAPAAVLTYESAGFAFDGRLRLRGVRLRIADGLWRGNLRARIVHFGPPNSFWLISEALSGDTDVPSTLIVDTLGLDVSDIESAQLSSTWLPTPALALFETLGCGNDALTAKDRTSMGVALAEREDRLEYRYEPAAKRLDLKLELRSPGVAHWHASAEMHGYSPSAWIDAGKQRDIHLARAELAYEDPGYLVRRNRFCAQWLGIPIDAFVERHAAAVDALLATYGVVASSDVRTTYRKLVAEGGQVQVISLPESGWRPADINAYPRSELLRVLNVTARRGEAQPIMLRLAFNDPEEPFQLAAASPVDGFDAAPVEVATMESPAEDAADQVAIDARLPTLSVVPREEGAPMPATSVPDEVIAAVVGPGAAVPDSPLQAAEIAPADAGAPRSMPAASAPAPPENSTLALVWKPGVIEKATRSASAPPDDDVVDARTLREHAGRRVRLVTSGGRRIEGRVSTVDGGNLVLVVPAAQAGGNAQLNVPLSNIVEARLVRRR